MYVYYTHVCGGPSLVGPRTRHIDMGHMGPSEDKGTGEAEAEAEGKGHGQN